MAKIDVSDWKEFVVGDLFDISPTKAYKLTNKDLFEDDGKNPVIVNTGFNNGIGGYTNLGCTEKAGTITFTDTAAKSTDSFFYQEHDFVGYSHVQGMYSKTHNLNKYESWFFTSVIKSLLSGRYDFISKMTRTDVMNLRIKLPATAEGTVDWTYMERYMRNIEIKVYDALSKLQYSKDIEKKKIDISNWGKFHLYDKNLFSINSGTKLDKVKMDTNVEEISFVGRSNMNNGITAKVKKIEGLEPYSKGNLTLALGGAYLGSCFVQPDDFYTSQNVVVLIPNNEMSYNVKQFIASTIFRESQNNYQAFIKELNAHIKKDFQIKLPVTTEGTPDWNYMEKYMQQMQKKVEQLIKYCI